jgi:hypothetical protein
LYYCYVFFLAKEVKIAVNADLIGFGFILKNNYHIVLEYELSSSYLGNLGVQNGGHSHNLRFNVRVRNWMLDLRVGRQGQGFIIHVGKILIKNNNKNIK